jgi:hypothetical protein
MATIDIGSVPLSMPIGSALIDVRATDLTIPNAPVCHMPVARAGGADPGAIGGGR